MHRYRLLNFDVRQDFVALVLAALAIAATLGFVISVVWR